MVCLMLSVSFAGPVESLDWHVQNSVQAHRAPLLERPMRFASDIGRPQLALGVLLAIAAFGGAPGAATARFAIMTLIPTNLAVEGLKRATLRARPDGDQNPANASFPSSHAANAFALAWVLARRWRRWTIPFFLFAGIVAFSRIYLNRHFLSDVLCGAAIGLASAWVAQLLLERDRPRDAATTEGRVPS